MDIHHKGVMKQVHVVLDSNLRNYCIPRTHSGSKYKFHLEKALSKKHPLQSVHEYYEPVKERTTLPVSASKSLTYHTTHGHAHHPPYSNVCIYEAAIDLQDITAKCKQNQKER
jgi:hypothetical protein